jgi:hypothetical protein
MNLITGHNLLQPSAPDAPLEFIFSPGDAELVAAAASGIDALRLKNANESTKQVNA